MLGRALALMALAAPIAAQQGDSTHRHRAPTDTGHAQPLTPVVVTGTRLSPAADERTPVQVDVIDLRATPSGPGAMADAIARLPGVSVFDDQGTRAQPTLNIRGFTLSPVIGVAQGVSVFLDGVRINEPDAQELNFNLIPVEVVEHAELIRGPTALFGKNTLAGALNLFTGRGVESSRMEASIVAGSFGHRAAHVVASGQSGGTDALLLAKGSTEGGYRDDTRAITRQLFTTIGRRSEARDVALSILYAHDEIREPGSLPESWLRADRRANYTGGDSFRPDLLHVALRGMHRVAGGQLRGNVFTRRNDIEQFNANADDANTRAFIANNSLGGTLELDLPARLGVRPFVLTVGGEYARNDVGFRIFQEENAYEEIDDDCMQETGLCHHARVKEDNAALYAQGRLELGDRLSITAGARGDYVRIPFRDIREPENDGTHTYWRISPRLGANVRLSDAVRGYAVVSTGFRAPAALELACASESSPCPLPFSLGADPRLEPVKVRNYEAGIDWEPREGLALDVVAFRADVRDEILFTASKQTAGFFQNVARTRREGVEGSASVALPAGLSIFGSYAYVDATFRTTVLLHSAHADADSARPGDRFPMSPRHRATVGVGAKRAFGTLATNAELLVRAVSSQFMGGDEANDYPPLPGYAITNARLTLEHRRVGVTLHVSNLLDRRYESFGTFADNPLGPPAGQPILPQPERFLTPGYPRTATLSVNVRR